MSIYIVPFSAVEIISSSVRCVSVIAAEKGDFRVCFLVSEPSTELARRQSSAQSDPRE